MQEKNLNFSNSLKVLLEYFNGKKVCICGGAENFVLPSEYDTYIFCNSHIKQIPNGSAKQIQYYNGSANMGLPSKAMDCVVIPADLGNAKLLTEYLLEVGVKPAYYLAQRYKYENPINSALEWSNKLKKKYNFMPLMGAFALESVLSCAPKRVFVTGMTLYSTNKIIPKWRDSHDLEAHKQYFIDQKTDPSVIYDPNFEEVLTFPIEDSYKQQVFSNLQARVNFKKEEKNSN